MIAKNASFGFTFKKMQKLSIRNFHNNTEISPILWPVWESQWKNLPVKPYPSKNNCWVIGLL